MQTPRIEIAIGRSFPKKVIPLINNAKISITIIVYDWGWYKNEIGEQVQIFNNAIIKARRKGVVVKAIVYKEKIKHILEQQKIWCKKLDTAKLMHIKLMIIDEKIVIVGSHNYTKNAFNINHELSLIISDPELAQNLKDNLQPLFL